MLSVILEFDVLEGKKEEFIEAWTKGTEVIYENFGSLGSRLHESEHGSYIAYAQWPSAEFMTSQENGQCTWSSRERIRSLLKTGKPKLLYKLTTEVDLLKSETYH